MYKTRDIFAAAIVGSGSWLLITSALAGSFNVPRGTLASALEAYSAQSGVQVAISSDALQGAHTQGAVGEMSADQALSRILSGTGFTTRRVGSSIAVVRTLQEQSEDASTIQSIQLAQAASSPRAAVETVTVTSSKLGGADVQSIPIAITALSQEQLAATQTTGGPDLIKQVPNMTFTKTNFSGYSIQIRGIGTQAISVTTDPAVAVAFNDMPFIRNHFFEQEFYDVAQVEVLRGPQGTLYGRNATAGVVNLTSAKPTDQFEGMASADIGNYKNRRFEGMLNLPIVDDRLDIRLAGEWTKRDGYSLNSLTDKPIDGRDLWSGRASVRFKPTEKLTADFVWEHFQENDDRIRSAKQLCKRDNGPTTINGVSTAAGASGDLGATYLSQICSPVSLYSPEAFQVPNGLALAYYGGLIGVGFGQSLASILTFPGGYDPYARTVQSTDLRVIESTLNPGYRAKNNVFELNTDYQITPALTVTSATGYNNDFLWSTEDYNRFNTAPGIFSYNPDGSGASFFPTGTLTSPDGNYRCNDGTLSIGGNHCADPTFAFATGYFCDPQLGCSNRMVAEDLVEEHAWQLNQEFRLASNFSGPLNFSVGGNFMHYETEENYFVFFNTLTAYNAKEVPGLSWNPSDQSKNQCIGATLPVNPAAPGSAGYACSWMDPGPIDDLDYAGHNYFLSQNPYVLNSYAGFGEVYYNVLDDLKLTGGLRWTDDQKHFVDIPSALLTQGYGYVVTDVVDQGWKEWTGRFAANWTPKLDFTDQTLVYATFGHGYKAGGANPPGALFTTFQFGDVPSITHPLTFAPEFINAYELGTKNTLLDGALTLNGNFFYYDYKGYQISEIVDRTSINLNFDATIKGAELETTWEPLPGLKFTFSGGYEQTRVADGTKAIDLMDRTAGNPNWILVKPFVTQASNCVLPTYVIAYLISSGSSYGVPNACGVAYNNHNDPVTAVQYTAYPTGVTIQGRDIPPGSYPGFDPLAGTAGHPYTGQNTWDGIDYGPAPNNGEGFYKDLSGNELPNAPHFTTSFTAEYSMPVTEDWAATLHGDFYWQASSWARIINDDPYDRLRGYKTFNLALILTSQSGWQATGYIKNVFDTTAITGTFLNSDDSGLTTNVFLTDPRLFGVRVTKNW